MLVIEDLKRWPATAPKISPGTFAVRKMTVPLKSTDSLRSLCSARAPEETAAAAIAAVTNTIRH
jgi:hypothetical protein